MKFTDVGKKIRVASFFSGAGGLDLGFDLAGFELVYATDIDAPSCETLKANREKKSSNIKIVEQADIRNINPSSLPKDIDLVIGGPPCQSFSASGRRAGGAAGTLDARGTLFEAYCRIIDSIKPQAFLFENVRGILGTNKGKDWELIVQAFIAIGYKISYRILDALDYGAPQQRERMLLVGHKLKRDFLFPRPILGPDSLSGKPHISSGDALVGIVEDENLENLVLRDGKYSHLLPLVPPGENYLFFTAKRGYPNPVFAYRSRFSDFLYKANPELPIKTLIASPGKYTGPFHWDNRSFSIKEYMRLQGFPDDYIFIGDRSEVIKQIGNSVSPKLSYVMALAIAKQIFKRKVDLELISKDFALSFDSRKGKKAAQTREMHNAVARSNLCAISSFKFKNYTSCVYPNSFSYKVNNEVVAEGSYVKIKVKADSCKNIFAKVVLEIFDTEEHLASNGDASAILDVTAYGENDYTIQTMWNAVDDWVIKSSNFHSLFELYGHFTEPHPVFRVKKFIAKSEKPVALFAKHVSRFDNCSKYFPKEHLTKLFGCQFGVHNFVQLVKLLRSYRFDIRCQETNIAMPSNVYMVSYPFTLPFGKQMNFSVK